MATTLNDKAREDKAFQLMDELSHASWYENAGETSAQAEKQLEQVLKRLQVENYEIKWAQKENASELIQEFTFASSDLWSKLKDVPDQLKERIEEAGKEDQLSELIEWVPELIYLATFDRAYKIFEDEKVIQYLVVHGMYISFIACIAELAGDNSFAPIVAMVKEGHIPLGIKENTIYLL
jgi:hypothetical protein